MARPLLRWVQVGHKEKPPLRSALDVHRATPREQSDLGRLGRTKLPEGVGLER